MLSLVQNASRLNSLEKGSQHAPELLEDVDEEELLVATVQYT